MEIHKLEVFIDLSETLNYTETAERQFTSQGNVSKQIISLEKELGVKLFNRAHKKIELSEAGRSAFPYIQNIVDQCRQMEKQLLFLKKGAETVLQISTIPTLINQQGFTKMIEFFNHHPEITLQLKEAETESLVSLLNHSEHRMIYTRFFDWHQADTDVLVTEEDQFVVLLPKTHPLADQQVVSLTALKDESFLVLSESTLLKKPVIELCRRSGFEPKIVNESARIELLVQMVKEGLGVAIIMRKSFELNSSDQLAAIPISPNITSKLGFVKRKNDNSSAVNQFWQYLKESQHA